MKRKKIVMKGLPDLCGQLLFILERQ